MAIEFNCNWNWTSKSSQKKAGHKHFSDFDSKKKFALKKKISCFFQIFMFKMIKKYFFFFISCFYLVKWPSYFTLCENGYFTKMCTTVHKINFFNFFFQNLKIYYIEMVQFIFEGSRTNLRFWSKFAYVLVRTGVPPNPVHSVAPILSSSRKDHP